MDCSKLHLLRTYSLGVFSHPDRSRFADSYCFNPHKWLFTNFDCTALFVRDKASFTSALSVVPEYLRNEATKQGVVDFRDWQVPLGRRFRSLKLWFVLRYYGLDALRGFIRGHIALAQEFKRWVEADNRFESAAPAPLNLVTFRLNQTIDPSGEKSERLLGLLNKSGKLFLSHTKLNGKYTLRFCVGQTHTERRHVEAAWELIRETANTILSAEN